MSLAEISVALDLYDRHMPFFTGAVTPPVGVTLRALEVGMVPPRRHGVRRHARMLHDLEFDFCELSLVSYIIARSRGTPITAIPVFPRRLFSQNHVYVRDDSPIEHPRDLRGKRVLVWAFQVTMSVLAKGDFRRAYGLDWRDVTWVAEHAEEVPWTPPADVRLERAPSGRSPAELLRSGEVDAYINPHPPLEVLEGDGQIRRLFRDSVGECERHFAKTGYFPIMHLIGVHPRVASEAPHLLREMMRLWDEAKHIAADYYTDHNFSMLAFSRHAFDRQRTTLGRDLWPSGFAVNRVNLERFLEDCVDQHLIERPLAASELFHPSTLDT
jgi:4,5-dihydroxyphthalate decarboxylase